MTVKTGRKDFRPGVGTKALEEENRRLSAEVAELRARLADTFGSMDSDAALRVRALDHSPISTFIKDADDAFRYVFANDFVLRQLGLGRDELVGKTDFDLFPKAIAASYRRHDEQAMALEMSTTVQESYVDRSGATRYVQSVRWPLARADGRRLLVGYSLDLTELVKKQRRIEALQKSAERERDHAIAAERAKDDFFASISHDIRTPLNSIIGFSELLKNETDEAARREYLEGISFSGDTLLELVNEVLDIASLDSGRMAFVREPFDLRRQVRLILRTFEASAREKSLFLKADVGDLPLVVLDEHRVRQVLFNLVGNAVKYTDAGGVTVAASFERTGRGVGSLRISVADTGIGIASEDVAKIMKPYVRLQAANARGGTGLGLSICKRIIDGMGGTLTISSEPGRGSSFAVVIPDVSCVDAGPGAPDEEPPYGAGAADVPATDLSALRVLVVDDIEMNRRVLVASCRRLGVRDAAEAASGPEALEIMRRSPRDIVLTDMKMPGMDGAQFAKAVRADAALRGTPLFLVTADIEARKYYRKLGADGLLLKPVVQARLAVALSSVCVSGNVKDAADGGGRRRE